MARPADWVCLPRINYSKRAKGSNQLITNKQLERGSTSSASQKKHHNPQSRCNAWAICSHLQLFDISERTKIQKFWFQLLEYEYFLVSLLLLTLNWIPLGCRRTRLLRTLSRALGNMINIPHHFAAILLMKQLVDSSRKWPTDGQAALCYHVVFFSNSWRLNFKKNMWSCF